MKWITTITIAACSLTFSPRVAAADDESYEARAGNDPHWAPDVGLTVIAGAGVTGFTNPTMRQNVTADVGPLWNVRVTLGSRTGLGVEAAYVGTTAGIHTLTGMQTGTLVGTTIEGGLRYNLRPNDAWDPYVAAGVGWQRYDVRNGEVDMALAGMKDSDGGLIFPVALGMAYRPGRSVVLDLHGTVRANATGDFVLRRMEGHEYAPMHTWELGAALGFDL